jgi:hypothetical protein
MGNWLVGIRDTMIATEKGFWVRYQFVLLMDSHGYGRDIKEERHGASIYLCDATKTKKG